MIKNLFGFFSILSVITTVSRSVRVLGERDSCNRENGFGVGKIGEIDRSGRLGRLVGVGLVREGEGVG